MTQLGVRGQISSLEKAHRKPWELSNCLEMLELRKKCERDEQHLDSIKLIILKAEKKSTHLNWTLALVYRSD